MNRRYRNKTVFLLIVASLVIGAVTAYTKASNRSPADKEEMPLVLELEPQAFAIGRSGANRVFGANGEPLQDAVFDVNDEQTGEKAAEITTGFDEEMIYEPKIMPDGDPPGKLLIYKRAEGTGAIMSGAVFSLHHNFSNQKITELTTDVFGEAMIELPAGEYYMRNISVPDGYILNTERTKFRIVSGEIQEVTVISRAEPDITPTPPDGRLVIVAKAEGTGENLQGAAFDIFDAINDTHVTGAATNHFGEASFRLPAGDYYFRQSAAAAGYLTNMDRIGFEIASGEIRVINITNMAEPEEEPTPDPSPTPSPADQGSGRLLLFMRSDSTKELLAEAVFSLHEARFDMQVGSLTTNQFGEATVSLPAGDYYLRQIQAPDGYILNIDRINVRIKPNEVTEITVNGKAGTNASPPPAVLGRLIVTLRAEGTGKLLQGAVFKVYNGLTDAIMVEKTTDQSGEVSFTLPAGDYFLRQASTLDGYVFNAVRLDFSIHDGTLKEINVMNRAAPVPTPKPTAAPTFMPTQTRTSAATSPPYSAVVSSSSTPTTTSTPTPSVVQGGLLLTTRAEQSGDSISGAVYGVYRVSDNVKVAELTTDPDGKANIPLSMGEYYLRELKAPFGYLPDPAKIFFTVTGKSTVRVDVTSQRDSNIPDIDVPDDFIQITQTGQRFPILNYVMGTEILAFAVTATGLLLRHKCRRKRRRRRMLDLA